MKFIRSCIFFLPLVIAVCAAAQVVKIPVGKKMTIFSEAKGTMSMTAMGQEVDIRSTTSNDGVMEFISANPDGYTIRNTAKRLKVVVTTLGNAQTIDSENAADRNNPAYTEAFRNLDKPVDIEIAGNKVKAGPPGSTGKQSLNGLIENFIEPSRLVLNGMDLSKLVTGHKWEDSSGTTGDFQMRTRYMVNKADEKGIELSVFSDLLIKTTISQMGMDAKAELKGTNTGKRLYHKTTGILITEETDTDMSGEITILDQLMPVSFKTKLVTTVKD